MVRIIDMECSVPRGAEGDAPSDSATTAGSGNAGQPAAYGMGNYGRIFRSRREGADHRPGIDLDAYVDMLAKLGIVRSVPFGVTNEETAALLHRYPDRFLGLARISINAFKGMSGVRELERLVRDEGFHALGVSALVDCIPASDRRYYPLYTKAAELGIPVRIYSSMNYANDRPYDLGHPRHLDQIAMDFPELKIIGGLGGWPWVNEMVALVRRHPNHAHPGQGARGDVRGAGRPTLRDVDPGISQPAAQRHRQGEVALQERRPRVRTGLGLVPGGESHPLGREPKGFAHRPTR